MKIINKTKVLIKLFQGILKKQGNNITKDCIF